MEFVWGIFLRFTKYVLRYNTRRTLITPTFYFLNENRDKNANAGTLKSILFLDFLRSNDTKLFASQFNQESIQIRSTLLHPLLVQRCKHQHSCLHLKEQRLKFHPRTNFCYPSFDRKLSFLTLYFMHITCRINLHLLPLPCPMLRSCKIFNN
jgi:hypothetical protein